MLLFSVGIIIGTSLTKNPSSHEFIFDKKERKSPQKYSSEVGSASWLIKSVRVIDGDTIEVESGERVRYIGMDTPETVDPRKQVQCFGKESSEKNRELVEGKYVRLEKDVSEQDRYGRLLRYVYVGGIFINLELVKQGYAYAATFPPDVAHASEFLKAEREAREMKKGLWKACPAR